MENRLVVTIPKDQGTNPNLGNILNNIYRLAREVENSLWIAEKKAVVIKTDEGPGSFVFLFPVHTEKHPNFMDTWKNRLPSFIKSIESELFLSGLKLCADFIPEASGKKHQHKIAA